MVNPYQVSSFCTFLSTALLGILVLAKGRYQRLPTRFGVYTLAISAWAFCWFRMVSAATPENTLFWSRALHVPAAFIPAAFLHFVQDLLKTSEGRRQLWLRWATYFAGVLFAVLSFHPQFVDSVMPKVGFPQFMEPGALYQWFFLFFLVSVSSTLILLLISVIKSLGFQKNQRGYVLSAYLFAYAGGGQVFLPVYDLPLSPYALYLIPLGHMLIAYAILRHSLLELQMVIRRSLVYSLVSAVLIAIYLGVLISTTYALQSLIKPASLLPAGLAAAAIAFLFEPLRRRIQARVDRLFLRERIDSLPLEVRDEVLNLYSSGLTHELKTPLAHILSPAELALLELKDVQEGKRTFDTVVPKVIGRLDYIIHQVLEASRRFEAMRYVGESHGEKELINIAELVDRAIAQARDLRRIPAPTISNDAPIELSSVYGQRKQLEIVVFNLIKNAIEANAQTITVQASRDERMVILKIKDDGTGIDASDLNQLFEPGFSRKGKLGSGIGLYLCRQIVERHSGSIKVEANTGSGATFVIRLPIQKEHRSS